ncbi:histidine-tRNA ligase [Coprinopsis cinerea okayama7|uniref:histidine--tRNA ligase n=1 Tax=Coprinopsis cinerea (strain Okayama-7 / 130 / ATCC MYA-4618 / FGSC 9003) TaxID=240176 RepID=D6RKA6_COPC7|nr:histidine-tRNA ligase [Coprinopsis cinerea okayama7\|eukprot:XP_002912267.1 histidine-tRNA ligase [Coprinopsis cinerea okayama7\
MSSTAEIPTTPEALEAEITSLTATFNDLRLNPDKASSSGTSIDDVKKRLGELKKALALAKNAGKEKKPKDPNAAAAAPAPGGAQAQKKERLLLKTAKGTKDYNPAEMFCRDHIERIVKECFTTFGGACLDTPVFERKDVLTDKYGEDSKLIFDLKDQGGEELALRYDHTVPLARYLAMQGGNNTQSKIWQIGKVYRRDNPVMSKGRMREFMQADFDITGVWDPMIPDAEILSMISTALTRLDVGEFTIKLNHRKILDGLFAVCGVPPEKIRSISSAVDKLDKLPWSEVKREMTEEKGLDEAIADRIGEYVKHKAQGTLETTSLELLEWLKKDEKLTGNKSAKEGLEEVELLFRYLKAYGVLPRVSFDLSLARGLDYYTGVIYEVVVAASAPPGFNPADAFAESSSSTPAPAPPKKKANAVSTGNDDDPEIDESQVGVGSIAAGGRYDNLVSSFVAASAGISLNPTNAKEAKEAKKILQVPCVGISIGMDRIFALVWPKWEARGARAKEVMVYVMSAGDGLLEERIGLVKELRESGIKTDYLAKSKPKLPAQFAAGEKDYVPFAIILGGDELKEGLVTVKEQKWELRDGKKVKVEDADKGTKVRRDELVAYLKNTNVWKDWEARRWE